jgi:acyl carrier protein
MQEFTQLVEILENYVEVEDITPESNFRADLEMSSFDTMCLVNDIQDTFGVELQAVDFVNNNIDEASALIEKAGIIPKAAVAKKAIPNCNICLITGEEMKSSISQMLKVLFEANAASVGGKLPDDEFYH